MKADTKYGKLTEQEKKHISFLYYAQMYGLAKIIRLTGRSIPMIKKIIDGKY